MDSYKPVPVTVAQVIAKEFGKNIVIIIANDPACDKTHFTSYGVTVDDKHNAAQGAELCAKAIGCELSKATTYEDFRRPLSVLRAWRDGAFRDALADPEKIGEYFLAPLKVGLDKGLSKEDAVAIAIGDFVCNAMDSTDINPTMTGEGGNA